MSTKKPNRTDLCLSLISEANKRKVKLDMTKLNKVMLLCKRMYGMELSTSRNGVYNADLINDLTKLISDGLVQVKKHGDQAHFLLTPAGKKSVFTEIKSEAWIILFPDNHLRGTSGPRSSTSILAQYLLNSDSMITEENVVDLATNYEFVGDLMRDQGRFDDATRLYSIALMLDAPPDRKVSVCFDLSDMFHQLKMSSLSCKYAEKAKKFLNVSARDKFPKYSDCMQRLLGFRKRFYNAVAEAWCQNKIDSRQFGEALDSYPTFYLESRFDDLKKHAERSSNELVIFSSLLHDIGHCPYSPQWLPYAIVDDLLTRNEPLEQERRYQVPTYLEFLSLVLVEVALCAYFTGNISEAMKNLTFLQKIVSQRRDDPIGKTASILASCIKNQRVQLDRSVLDRFDSDLRRAISLMPIRVSGEKVKASFSKEFGLSLQESQELLDFLDSIATEEAQLRTKVELS